MIAPALGWPAGLAWALSCYTVRVLCLRAASAVLAIFWASEGSSIVAGSLVAQRARCPVGIARSFWFLCLGSL